MTYALVGYQLSSAYRARLEQSVGPIDVYLYLGEFRRLPLRALVRKLVAIGGECLFIPLDEEGNEAVLSTLVLVGSLTRARRLVAIGREGEQFHISRWKVFPAATKLVFASVSSLFAGLRCKSELNELERANRISVSKSQQKLLSYLRTDLWFGVKAGGSVGHMAGVINGFARRGYEVEMFSMTKLEMLEPSVISHTLKPPGVLGVPFESNNFRFHRILLRQALAWMEKRRPGLLYHRMSVANYTGVVLSRMLQIPLVVEYNGSEAWIAKHWGKPLRYHDVAMMAENVMLKHAHLVVTVSDVLRDELVDRGIDPGRIVMYPNCIDPAIFAPDRFRSDDLAALRSLLELEKDDTVVTFVGTFGKWHGAQVLARGIQHLVDGDPEWLDTHRVRFLFVGDGLEMPRVREILASARTGEFIRFVGLVPQAHTPQYLAASDILVSPHVPNLDGSRFFGSPTKLFEYMAMAKGIVASDLEQIGQVLKESLRIPDLALVGDPTDREMAVLVRPDDEKELIEGIRFLVERPDWRLHLGANARREVLARYTWDRHVSAILDGLHTVLEVDA